jgi:hypothetical protein
MKKAMMLCINEYPDLLFYYQTHPEEVSIPADFPTCLNMVTLLKGSPKIPSWIAQERNLMLEAAEGDLKGDELSSFLTKSPVELKPY